MYLDYLVDIPDVKGKPHIEPKEMHGMFTMNTIASTIQKNNLLRQQKGSFESDWENQIAELRVYGKTVHTYVYDVPA